MSPFSSGPPLFKTAAGESLQAAPLQAASPAPPAQQAPLLTVADILPQLPPEMTRFGAVPAEQTIAIPAQVLDAALRSGHAAVPLFEVYRTCPALFQAPVSPQDPRLVPLPASKLPRLIASTQQAPASGMAAAPGTGTPPPPSSPFGSVAQPGGFPPSSGFGPSAFGGPENAAMPTQQATALPPRRQGPPPPLGDVQNRPVPPLTLPGAPMANPAAPTPGAPMGGAFPPPSGKPMGSTGPAAPAPAPANPPSPFGSLSGSKPFEPAPSMSGSPFQTAPASGSPATAENFGTPANPLGTVSGTGSPFGNGAPAQAPPAGAPPPPAVTSTVGSIRVSLSSLLKGYTVADLGFDPTMIPSWIMTALPAAAVREQISTGNVVTEVGTLIDSITDQGFRKLLTTARRDFQVKLPTNELFHALSGTSAAPAPSLAKSVAPQPSPAPPPVESAPAKPANGGGGFIPLFSEAPAPSQPQPPPSSSAPAPAPVANPFHTSPMSPGPGHGESPAPAVFSRPAPPPSPVPSAQAPIPFQVKTYDPFARPAAPVEAPPPPAASPMPKPIPPATAGNEGFSSEQLLAASGPTALSPSPGMGLFAGHQQPAEPAPLHRPTVPNPPADPLFEAAPPPHTFGQPASRPPQAQAAAEPPRNLGPATTPIGHAMSAPPASMVGVQRLDSNPDQILLRALLGTDETLNPQRIVELTSQLPGIASCVCIFGQQALSHAGAHKPQARDFQRQAIERAQHLRSLAPLIGIEGAETFTLNAGDRLMTFCFPDNAILGVLHDIEPSLGLREKITLIARELARMLA